MKTIQKAALVIILITLISSCRSNTDTKQILSSKETRKGIIDTIAGNSEMMKEMTEAMMNSKNSKTMMQGNDKMTMMMMENRIEMRKVMKDKPFILQNMMADIMETVKSDSSVMLGMCKTIIGNPQMKDMIQKLIQENKDINKMNGINNIK